MNKWKIFFRYRNRAKRTISKIRKGFFDGVFSNASTKDMWNSLRSAYASNIGSVSEEIDVNETNDYFLQNMNTEIV